jgi:glycine/D-amino acid oxidase-like deaminating enzyme
MEKIQANMTKIVFIGGGFYSLYLATYLAKQNYKVDILEAKNDVMQRASYNNQARVHNGYHYPRSVLTALKSRVLFPQFCSQFQSAIVDDFDKIYLIASKLSKVNSSQFERFMGRIGASYYKTEKYNHLLNPQLIENIYKVQEVAFDAHLLKKIMLDKLSNVNIHTNTKALKVTQTANGLICHTSMQDFEVNHIFNCTYANLNQINHSSNLPLVPLKHEITEMALVQVPEELQKIGITVMCGAFFSIMPFPDKNLHSFSHVRYTPHLTVDEKNHYTNIYQKLDDYPKQSAFLHMQKDAVRYLLLLKDLSYKESLWECKTLLPSSEVDDSRPILFKTHYYLPNYHLILGGKIDNIFDALEFIQKSLKL